MYNAKYLKKIFILIEHNLKRLHTYFITIFWLTFSEQPSHIENFFL